MTQAAAPALPILLYNGECAVCRFIARWVQSSMDRAPGIPGMVERPIGDDPVVLRAINPALDIWDAYATIHLVMPDGSMKTGGEAVAEVLRDLPNTKWFSWTFAVGLFGMRPFQLILNAGYTVLAETRPLLGCESCGSTNAWVTSIHRTIAWVSARFRAEFHPSRPVHSNPHRGRSTSKERRA